MIQLLTEQSQVNAAENTVVDNYSRRLQEVLQAKAYDAAESSINLPGDDALLQAVNSLVAQKVSPQLKYSIVIGIGGSNLGAKAVYDALRGQEVLHAEQYPKLLFAETTDPQWLVSALALLQTLTAKEEVLVTVISKSGGTTETLANFEIIAKTLQDLFGDISDRVVAITDEDSKLWQAATARHIDCLAIPKQVGGRYSVLSAVGLFPLATVGIDIAQLRQGAREVLDLCFTGDNIAARSAQVLATKVQQGCRINDNFFFCPELESVGKWYRQLMGESIGKEQSLAGEVVHAGITPTVSLGSTDLHSVGQLYLGGPKDKITTFVSCSETANVEVPEERYFAELVPMINHKTGTDIMDAILAGVKVAYQKADLPYMEVVLDAIDERSLGAFLQFKMIEMMYLGQLLNVNSFDQPNVEAYKIETKRLLEAEVLGE